MDLFGFLLIFNTLWKISLGIRCYVCEPVADQYERMPLCHHFDYSEKYIKDCPLSTVCRKKVTSYSLLNVTIIKRDCPGQVMNGYQERVNGKWQYVDRIYEAYNEGCKEDPADGRDVTVLNCYCRGDLCNSGTDRRLSIILVWLGVILLYFS